MPCSDGRAAGILALATLHLFSLGAAIHCPHSFIYLFWVLLSGPWASPAEGGATGTGFFLWGETSASAKKETNTQKEKGCAYTQNGPFYWILLLKIWNSSEGFFYMLEFSSLKASPPSRPFTLHLSLMLRPHHRPRWLKPIYSPRPFPQGRLRGKHVQPSR